MKIEFRVNPSILRAALDEDAAKAHAIIDNVQAAWDAGDSFLTSGDAISDLFDTKSRESDSEEEMAAAATLMQGQLSSLALDGAMRAISKDAAVAMCNALVDADPFAAIKIYGIEMPITEFVRRWNAVHPDGKFYLAPAFEK